MFYCSFTGLSHCRRSLILCVFDSVTKLRNSWWKLDETSGACSTKVTYERRSHHVSQKIGSPCVNSCYTWIGMHLQISQILMWGIAKLAPQTQSVAPQNDTTHPSWRRSWCFSSSFNASAAFVCSSCREANGSWNLDRRCSSLAPRHPPVGKMHPPCKDHPRAVSLKWWLGCVKETWLHPHNFLRRETPAREGSAAVELLIEKCIKPLNAWGTWNVMDQV